MRGNYKDVEIRDGERAVKVRIYKMDSVSALNWMTKLCVALVNAGVPLPKRIAASADEFGAMLAKYAGDGNIFRMPGLTVAAVRELWCDLLPFAFVVGKQKDGRGPELIELNEENLGGQFEKPSSLLKLFGEVLEASLGFFGRVKGLLSGLVNRSSGSPDSGTSTPLSES